MSAPPWMPLYVGDYLADTQHLTTEQHGAYLLILMTLWRQGGRLPAQPAQLARVARVTPKRWRLIAPALMPLFTVDDGVVTHKRLLKEQARVASISEKRSLAGKASAAARALKSHEAGPAHEAAGAGQAAGTSQSQPQPDITTGLRPNEGGAGEPEGFAAFWDAYPHKVRRPRAAIAFAAAIGRAPAAAILAGLARYAAHKPADRQWLNPATFLREERWADQPAAAGPRGESVGDMIRSSLGRLREG